MMSAQFVDVVRGWLDRHFADEEAVYLVALVFAVVVLFATVGRMLTPCFVALVIAFLLQGFVALLTRLGVRPRWAVVLTFALFLGGLIMAVILVLPLVFQQTQALLTSLPALVERLADGVSHLPARFPGLITDEQIAGWTQLAQNELGHFGQWFLQATITQLPSLLGIVVYLVLVPTLVFFFLKDKDALLALVFGLLPAHRPLLNRIGAEMSEQIAAYVRGKFIEVILLGGVTYAVFALFGLRYAVLLAVLVGLSAIVPIVGAALVTVPVAAVALLQWGGSSSFGYLLIAHLIIQALDGYVVVPLLFSEAVDLHPVLIIVAVLFFGGIWGIWGIFFAIPLAALVKAIYRAWPRTAAMPV